MSEQATPPADARLRDCRHWVFDMDGTLTVAVHDFPAIKRALNIPQDEDILHHLSALPADEAAAKHAWLLEHERDLAIGSVAAPGAVALVRALHGRGCRLGILTRNAHELALLTLAAIGLGECFAPLDVVGRGEAPPKPDPGGLLHLATRWGVGPGGRVVVGGGRVALGGAPAARAPGGGGKMPGQPRAELTDLHATDCQALLARLAEY